MAVAVADDEFLELGQFLFEEQGFAGNTSDYYDARNSYLHEVLDLSAANEWWSELTSIPVGQFGRPYRAVPDSSIRRAKHPMGCVRVRYGCARTHRGVMGLVNALLPS